MSNKFVRLSGRDVAYITKALKGMDSKVKSKMKRDMRKAAQPLKAKMKAEAPQDSKTLRKSIISRSSKYKDAIDLKIGPRIRGGKFEGWYSHFVELGTKSGSGDSKRKGQRANPFIQRAWDSTEGTVTEAVLNAVKKYIKF